MADEDDCEFPEDWGACDDVAEDQAPAALDENCHAVENDIVAEPEEDLQGLDDDLAAEDACDGIDLQDEADDIQVEGEADQTVEGEADQMEDAVDAQLEEVAIEEDDDDDLAAAEAAALAALGTGGDNADPGDAQVASREPNPAPSKAPIAKVAVAKTPAKGPSAKGPIAKGPLGKGPVGSFTGKNSVGKGSVGPARPLPAGKVSSGKGSKDQIRTFPAGKHAGEKGASAPPWQKDGARTGSVAGSVQAGKSGTSHPLGKACGKNKQAAAAAAPASSGQASAGKAKSKGKDAPKDGGVGHKVLALNKKGHWQTGRGISVSILTKLRELPTTVALELLTDLEGRGSAVQNPSKFLIEKITARTNGGTHISEGKASSGKGKKASAVEKATSTPPWRSGTATAPAERGVKRSLPAQSATPAAKRGSPPAQAEDDVGIEDLLEQLEPAVFQKVQDMRQVHEFTPDALRALATAAKKDAMVLLQAFLNRVKDGKAPDLTRFIVKSLEARRAGAGQTPQTAGAKAGAAKAPLAKAPIAKAPIAKAPVAKASRVPTQGIGKPPVARHDLEFDQMAVQGKLQSLNKIGIWQGSHPLDEAALGALLAIDPGRALEILDEAEEKGAELKNPSEFVRKAIQEDPR